MLTARHVAELVGGEVRGDAEAPVHGVAPIDRATPGQLTFLASAKYAPLLANCSASVALVAPELADTPGGVAARVVVAKPQEAMLRLLPVLFVPPARRPGIDPTARIGRGAVLGEEVTIGPYVVIGDGARIGDRVQLDAHVVVGDGVEIGDDSHLFPHVTTYPGTRLGHRVVAHAGARLGNDGFGFVYTGGVHQKIPHVGRCVIEDDVEIGANTTIDRGSIDDTVIGAGTKIDNLVMIGHNVRVGRLCLIVAQAGISGSTRLGDGCVIGGQVGISGHNQIGDGARIAAQAGVFGDVPAGETWSGYPARPHREALRAQAALFKLAGMVRRLEKLLGREES
ncbi:MAG: UDP-3-O-(3-hydroxymyristoyl)glucosamine N-acyltransferase [Gemmatimonadetes bacterium SCN 70-22]|mgnify:CR=1 FL=1|nr:MAG: UDP-3-O-(3-hydroxymyristoyl)glucosamine N-acyltransferase [Gemmatimonadetes bacterium SCN 70-22]